MRVKESDLDKFLTLTDEEFYTWVDKVHKGTRPLTLRELHDSGLANIDSEALVDEDARNNSI